MLVKFFFSFHITSFVYGRIKSSEILLNPLFAADACRATTTALRLKSTFKATAQDIHSNKITQLKI